MTTLKSEIDDALSELADAMNDNNKIKTKHILEILEGLGRPKTYLDIAMMYEFGNTKIAPRNDLAFEWYVKSAFEQDDCDSYMSIGRFYYYGNHVDKSFEQFIKYYEVAYDLGCSVAGINLAAHYVNGDGVAIDLERAEKYLKPALAEGYIAAFALLSKIELLRKHYFRGWKLYIQCVIKVIRLGLLDPQDRKFYSLKNEQLLKNDVILTKKESEQ